VRVRAEGSGGPRSITGTLVEAGDASLRLSLGDGEVEIPFSEVREANALESSGVAG